MHKLNSGVVGIDHGEVVMFSDFEDDGQMWRGDGPRNSLAAVSFATSFMTPPHVQVSISMWDISIGMLVTTKPTRGNNSLGCHSTLAMTRRGLSQDAA